LCSCFVSWCCLLEFYLQLAVLLCKASCGYARKNWVGSNMTTTMAMKIVLNFGETC
jgi:hypothetical protein